MKRILCYGDSNTWGSDHQDTRYDDGAQWPNIVQGLLGKSYKLVQEGLCARVAGNFDQDKPHYNGQSSYEVIFRSAGPVDVVIIALGTNDLKMRYGRTVEQICDDLLWYQEKTHDLIDANNGIVPKFIYILPPNFVSKKGYYEAQDATRRELNKYIDDHATNTIIVDDLEMSDDGVHFTTSAHKRMANLVVDKLEEVIR